MKQTWIRRSLFAVAAAALLPLLPAVAGAALTDGPNVISGYDDGPANITGGVYAQVASLALPKGTWYVRATAYLEGNTYGLTHHVATCKLMLGGGVDTVTASPTGSGGGSSLSLLLTMTHKFNAPGSASLTCTSDAATGELALRFIKITGVQIGQLTSLPFGGASTTVGTGSPRVITGYKTASTSVAADGHTHQVARLPLPAGRWWVLAKGVVSAANAASLSDASCTLQTGGTSDGAQIGPNALGAPVDQIPFSVQLDVDMAAKGAATLVCGGGPGAFKVSKLRITAMKAGTLTTGVLGGSSWTSGSGNPVIVSGFVPGGFAVAPGALALVKTLPLPAGMYAVSARLGITHFSGATITTKCQLHLGNDYDEGVVVQDATNLADATMTLQGVHAFAADGEASLWCAQTGTTGQIGVGPMQITAVRAGAIANGGI
jgi:hypothetical protein